MAGIRQGIIKRKEVHASGARAADASLLGTALRIPSEHVKVGARTDEATALWQSRPLIRREVTATADRPIEVKMRVSEHVQRPQPKNSDTEPTPPDSTPEEVEAAWQLRLEEARIQAFAEGREAGHAAATAEYEKDLLELKRQFAEDLDAIQQSWDAYMRQSEPHLVQLAFRLARTVLDAPLPDEVRQIAERTVADAIERMATDVTVEIILHPVSFLRIQEAGIEEQLNAVHSKLRWRTNPDIKQNEWIVQSPRATTRRIESELIDELQRELASPSPPDEATS